jgi:hypothetical protein
MEAACGGEDLGRPHRAARRSPRCTCGGAITPALDLDLAGAGGAATAARQRWRAGRCRDGRRAVEAGGEVEGNGRREREAVARRRAGREGGGGGGE